MADARVLAWLLLLRLPGASPAVLCRLSALCGTPEAMLEAPRAQLLCAGAGEDLCESLAVWRDGGARRDALWRQRDADAAWLEREGVSLLALDDSTYPPPLRELSVPPPLLFVRGDLSALSAPQLALVGSRQPTPGGADSARSLAAALAARGLVVTSGLARGIDSVAHRAALVAGGRSVAVLGAGLDCIYPPEHRQLAAEVAASGAVVSEFPPGCPPLRGNFPRRNRVISGLSLGVLVIEAAERSGSLITARCAREQGREVMAVPGSPHNPMARGANALIREGAALVECAEDALAELTAQFRPLPAAGDAATAVDASRVAAAPPLDAGLRVLLEAVGFEPTPVDLAIARSRLAPAAVSAALAELELQGLVRRTPGGYLRMPHAGNID